MSGRRLRAFVVEDEWPARNYLVELIEDSQIAHVVGAVSTVTEAEQALSPESSLAVDVAFVDINIVGSGESAGLDLVRRLSSGARPPAFILATAFKQHAIEAFELGVVDYLLKPFTEERVNQCLLRLSAQIEPRSAPEVPARIVARHGKRLVFLEPHEVWAFEAADRLTFVHTIHGKFDLDLSLASIESSLGSSMTRVHRSWLVNLAFVRELSREGAETWLFVGEGIGATQKGVQVPVARERASAIRELLLSNTTGVRRS